MNRIISIGLVSLVCLIGGCMSDDGGKNLTLSSKTYSTTRSDAPQSRRTELEDKLARVEHKIEQKERKKKKAFLELQRAYIQHDLDELYQQRTALKEELSRLNQPMTPGLTRPQSKPAVAPTE